MDEKNDTLSLDQSFTAINNNQIQELIQARIEHLRLKLLDLSRRNSLISTRFSPRSNSHIRVVDELPDVLWFRISNQQKMRFIPLPGLEDDPRDEQTTEFQDTLTNARLTDEIYLEEVDKIDPYNEEVSTQNQQLERDLRDRVRKSLGMPQRQTSINVSLVQHAKNNQISPSYELPKPKNEHEEDRHTDNDIQTRVLPNDLERKLNGLTAKSRIWIQETGINVLHAAFGFLEWTEQDGKDSSLSPLVLMPVEIEKQKTRGGPEFCVQGTGDKAETNSVLAEKLRLDFGINLPIYEGGSVEEYLEEVIEASSKSPLGWRVRRQIAFGVFPSARMAMYHDLDTGQNSFDKNEVVSKLLGGSPTGGASPFGEEYDIDQPEIEEKVPYLVLDADSSQFSAMVDVLKEQNVAIEGPPGTGKSQTIVNTIAAAIARGKKVLFVAEKKAALDVVKSRLEAVGLGEFILPLQAERSTREKVIQSVRDRVEMKTTRSPKDYDRMIKEFKQTRSELAAYIDVISSHFGQTEFTIHDILWKSIATNDVRLRRSRKLMDPTIRDVLTYDQSRINSLRELGKEVEETWGEMNKAKSYWQGNKLLNINPFEVDEACDLAEAAADSYQTAVETRHALGILGIDSNIALPELKSLKTALDVLQSLTSIEIELISRACREDKLDTITSFVEECKSHQTAQQELSQIFTKTTDENSSNQLREIKSLCEDCGIDTLDIEALHLKLQELKDVVFQQEKTREDLRKFTDNLPQGISLTTSVLTKAREMICEIPREVLALRNEVTADPIAATIMPRIGRQGRELRERRDELACVLDLTRDISANVLSAHAATIQGAGLLSILSSNYRSAKRAYLSMSSRDSFKKELAAKDFRALAEWKEAEQNLVADQQASNVFGLHFQGIDTDFDLFDRLCNYYETVEREFPEIENRGIRKLLKTGDLELVVSIPEIGEKVKANTLEDLETDIENAKLYLSNVAQLLEKLETSVSFKDPAKIHVNSLDDLAERIDTQLQQKASLDENEEVRKLLGDSFNGALTNWKSLETSAKAMQVIMSNRIDLDVLLNILEEGRVKEELEATELVIQEDSNAETSLTDLSQYTKIDITHFSSDRTYAEIAEYLAEASTDREGLRVHSDYVRARQGLEDAGFDWVAEALLEEGHSLDGLDEILEAVVIRALAIQVFETHGNILAQSQGNQLDQLRARFAALDHKIIKMSRDHLKAKAHRLANPPHGNGVGRKSTWTEMALIKNEINKKMRFISIRDLIKRAGKTLFELKPCWMMSPLAVAQYLPHGRLDFDLCIIDEASQMPPEDSIGALARSRQAMVVGDTNQLPPTSFFQRLIDDEDADEDEVVLDESILEMANAAFLSKRRLRWHYRSRHPDLISFSNHMLYNDDLIVFPLAIESRQNMGVSLIQVQGQYRSGINEKEARAMIDTALRFMRNTPDRSLGIVTLNQKQRDLLQEEWDYSLSRDKVASNYVDKWAEKNNGLESFFIKNLENVQGDERDVIFIGTVYGPQELGGPVMQRFGPINGLAGMRRLNVLFSRAKEQIITFSSMTAMDIRADENGNKGAYMLKCWLEYSKTGVIHTGNPSYREPDSDFEVFVIDQLRSMGCEPEPQVGVAGYFIDIGVKHPDWPHGFIMGVECDGASYHSSKSARDRDRLRQEVLEGLGWHFHRIWSTDWFNDPRKEVEKLRRVIANRLDYLKRNSASIVTPIVDEPLTDSVIQEDEHYGETELSAESSLTTTEFTNLISTTDMLEAVTQSEEIDLSHIVVGDTVRVRYLSGPEATREVMISNEFSDPDRGIVHVGSPLGRVLLGAEEGDEIEVLIGSYVREAVIERVIKGKTEGHV